MDRGTRIAIVVSIVWLIASSYLISWLGMPPPDSLDVVDMTEPFIFLCALPPVIYWVYRACFGATIGLYVSGAYWLWMSPLVMGSLSKDNFFSKTYDTFSGAYSLLGFSPLLIVVAAPFTYGAYRFIRAGKPSKVNQPE